MVREVKLLLNVNTFSYIDVHISLFMLCCGLALRRMTCSALEGLDEQGSDRCAVSAHAHNGMKTLVNDQRSQVRK